MSHCKIEGCPYMATLIPSGTSPIHWTIGDEQSAKVPSKGAPLNPTKSTELCYFHLKKEKGYYDTNKHIGKASNPTFIMRSGKTRTLDYDWR
jgi:hypothetical protein